MLCGIPIICNNFNQDITNIINQNKLGIINEFQNNDYQTLIKYIKDNHYNYENINICNQFAKQHLSLTKGNNIYKKIYAEIS